MLRYEFFGSEPFGIWISEFALTFKLKLKKKKNF